MKKNKVNFLKNKQNNNEIDKIIKVNNSFNMQLDDILKKYDLTTLETTNLENLKLHLKNLNKLFNNFKK